MGIILPHANHLKMKIFCLLTLLIFAGSILTKGQDTDILLNHDSYHYIDRMDIKGLTSDFIPTFHKPYNRNFLASLFEQADTTQLSPVERAWHNRIRLLVDDNYADSQQSTGLWNTFYTNGRDLYRATSSTDKFKLYVNPAFHVSLGADAHTFDVEERETLPLYYNVRGIAIRGTIFDKIGFYTDVTDNVIRIPAFMYQRFEATDRFAGETFVKRFTSVENGLDFFSTRAYLTFSPIPQMRIKFGKDRAFWGHGFQSLLLSDHAPDYLFLNITTKVWKLTYVNQFAQMLDFIPGKADDEGTYPRKYAVFHQLVYYPIPNLSIGVFESIVYVPFLPNGKRGFEIQYLNPVIFYRSVEQSLGSPDNSFIGFSAKYNFLKQFQAYGQFVIDDLNISRRNDGDNYWGNKYGFQLGLKYIDAFTIPTLDLQVEYNRLRPYTYQHFNIAANYGQYDESLGHASGGNLQNWFIKANYHPFPNWNIELFYNRLSQGLDEDDTNFGASINRSYLVNRAGDFDQEVGQGITRTVDQLYGRLTYQLWKTDIYAEMEGRYRKDQEAESASIIAGLRFNIPHRVVKY